MTATPRPWKITGEYWPNSSVCTIDGKEFVADCKATEVGKEDAILIVRAVNMLDVMEEAQAVLKFTQKELQEARGNVTGLWCRVRAIDERIGAVLARLDKEV